MAMGKRGRFLVGGVSLMAVWVSLGLLLTLWGIGFTVGTMPGRIDPEYLRVVNRQANIVLVLMVAVHGAHAWGHRLVRFGGALVGSSALMVLLGYACLQWNWVLPELMILLTTRLVSYLAGG